MPASSNDRAIGQLEGKVDALLKGMETISARLAESDERASVSRAKLYERLERIDQSAAVRETHEAMRFDSIEKRISAVETAQNDARDLAAEQATKIDRWETRFATVVGIIGVIGGLIGGFMVYFKDRVMTYLSGT